MDEHEITQRLRDAGRQQVPGDVRSHHLARMHAAAPTVERPARFGRLAVAAAAFVGFAVGSTGFAMAGALPDPAQQVAHDVLSVVQVDVQDPKANRGQCVSAAARASGDDEAAKQAAKDACPKGKPDHAGKGKGEGKNAGQGKGRPDHAGTPGGPDGVPHAGDPCKGPPPWAGNGAKGTSAEEKQAFRDARATCPDDDGDDVAEDRAEDQADALEDEQEREAEAEAEQAPPADPGAEPGDQGVAPGQTPAGPPAEGTPGAAEQAPPVEVPVPTDATDPDAG